MTDNENKEFINEKIKERPLFKKIRIRRLCLFLLLSIIFGIFAGFSFYGTQRFLLNNEIRSNREDIKIANCKEIREDKKERPQQVVKREIKITNSFNLNDIKRISSAIKGICVKLSDSVVKIRVSKPNNGIFKDVDVNYVAGTVIADSEKYFYVISNYEQASEEDKLEIVGNEDALIPMVNVRVDSNSGIMVSKVVKSDLLANNMELRVIEIGKINGNIIGNPVIIYGNIVGNDISHSLASVISATNTDQYADGEYMNIVTNQYVSNDTSGVITDVDGKVLGIIRSRKSAGFAEALGIDDVIPIVDILSNNKKLVNLGINAVTYRDDTMKDVRGVFIKKLKETGASARAGLRPGDIILSIDGTKIDNVRVLQEKLREYKTNDIVKINILRKKFSNYNELSLNVELN